MLRGMQDTDPRPMPIEVQSAYRDPIDLLGLLKTDVYSPADRIAVRDALLSSLLATYGDAWVEVGSKEVRVTTHVKAFRKNIVDGVEMLLDVPDYRGREETLPLLAQAMEPRWAEWWRSFQWKKQLDLIPWRDATKHVLGQRQFAWLAAQYARASIDRIRFDAENFLELAKYLHAIRATENWARVPSAHNLRAALEAKSETALAAYYAASVAADSADDAAFNAVGAAYDAAYAGAFLVNITRRLITPTLVTSAFVGARRNPESKAIGKAARLEREVRSAADGRALSISGLKVGRALLVRMSPPLRGAEWVIVSHVRVHGEDEFAFFISDRAGTWPKRLLELHTVRGVRDFKGALEQMGYDLVAR